jgi:hypothetical protein
MRHAALYAIAGLVVVGCEALIVSRWHANAVTATTVASVIVEPFFVAIINAFTYADSREDLSLSVTWLRVLERSWAVLLIDLLATLICSKSYSGAPSSSLPSRWFLPTFMPSPWTMLSRGGCSCRARSGPALPRRGKESPLREHCCFLQSVRFFGS